MAFPSSKSELLLYIPVYPTPPRPRQPCSGRNAADPRVSHSVAPQCWACACTEPDPWGQRRPESGHRDHLRGTVWKTITFNNGLNLWYKIPIAQFILIVLKRKGREVYFWHFTCSLFRHRFCVMLVSSHCDNIIQRKDDYKTWTVNILLWGNWSWFAKEVVRPTAKQGCLRIKRKQKGVTSTKTMFGTQPERSIAV